MPHNAQELNRFEIDLEETLEVAADRSKSQEYRLHGVLIHSGDFYGGRYYAFIKPDQDSRWFNCDLVTPITKHEALEVDFGVVVQSLNNGSAWREEVPAGSASVGTSGKWKKKLSIISGNSPL